MLEAIGYLIGVLFFYPLIALVQGMVGVMTPIKDPHLAKYQWIARGGLFVAALSVALFFGCGWLQYYSGSFAAFIAWLISTSVAGLAGKRIEEDHLSRNP